MRVSGPIVMEDRSTKRICTCPCGPVTIVSLKMMSAPTTSVRTAPPAACALTAGLRAPATPTFSCAEACAAGSSDAMAVPARRIERQGAWVIFCSLEAKLRAERDGRVGESEIGQRRRHDVALELQHEIDRVGDAERLDQR